MFKALKPRKASRVHLRERLRRRHRCGLRDPSDLFELQMFCGAVPIGQYIYEGPASFTVPTGVYRISMCCIGEASVTVGGTVVCRSYGTPVGHGGGNGGSGGSTIASGSGGGGGAGGYTGDGGTGGAGSNGSNGSNGQDGGGGGGGGGQGGGNGSFGFSGGGTGLKGQGVNGPGGAGGSHGQPGSGGTGKKYGGGLGGQGASPGVAGNPGGHLRYTNSVAVTPGQTVTVYVSNGTWDSGVRIIHGGNRSYPFNAGDM